MLDNIQLMAVCGIPLKYFFKFILASLLATMETTAAVWSRASAAYLSIKQASVRLFVRRSVLLLSETGSVSVLHWRRPLLVALRAGVTQCSSLQHWAGPVIAAVVSTIHLLLQHDRRPANAPSMCV